MDTDARYAPAGRSNGKAVEAHGVSTADGGDTSHSVSASSRSCRLSGGARTADRARRSARVRVTPMTAAMRWASKESPDEFSATGLALTVVAGEWPCWCPGAMYALAPRAGCFARRRGR